MDIRLQGVVIIAGNYGSGKTEIAINLALAHRGDGSSVRVVDLDLVNPYFRTREARDLLRTQGIDLVLPPAPYLHADLPIVSPEVAGAIRQAGPLTILDVGGDDVGATVLASLGDAFRGQAVQMLQVINPHRPNTDTLEGCLAMRTAIETAAQLAVTGWIGNAHLMAATSTDTVMAGYRFASDLSQASGLPLAFITAPLAIIGELERPSIGCPVLPIQRQLTPPWQRAEMSAAPASGASGGTTGTS